MSTRADVYINGGYLVVGKGNHLASLQDHLLFIGVWSKMSGPTNAHHTMSSQLAGVSSFLFLLPCTGRKIMEDSSSLNVKSIPEKPDVLDLVFLRFIFFPEEFFSNTGFLSLLFSSFFWPKTTPKLTGTCLEPVFLHLVGGSFPPKKSCGSHPAPTGCNPEIYVQPPEQPLKAGGLMGYPVGCWVCWSHGLFIDDFTWKKCDFLHSYRLVHQIPFSHQTMGKMRIIWGLSGQY